MKRFALSLAALILTGVFVGCEGGGPPVGPPSQPAAGPPPVPPGNSPEMTNKNPAKTSTPKPP